MNTDLPQEFLSLFYCRQTDLTFTKVPARRDKIHGVAIDKRETKKSIGEYGPELLGKY